MTLLLNNRWTVFFHPVADDVKPNCEFQKICSGKERQVNRADVTCYDSSCTAIQQGQPIRMCRDCHNKQHKDLEDSRHIYQGKWEGLWKGCYNKQHRMTLGAPARVSGRGWLGTGCYNKQHRMTLGAPARVSGRGCGRAVTTSSTE